MRAMGLINATDAGIDMDQVADSAPGPDSIDWDDGPPGDRPGGRFSVGMTVYLIGCRAWEAWEDLEPAALLARADAVEARGGGEIQVGRCRCCGGRALRWSHYCCRCDRSGKDGRVSFRGLPVGSAMDPNWKGEGTRYVPDPAGRKGGRK